MLVVHSENGAGPSGYASVAETYSLVLLESVQRSGGLVATRSIALSLTTASFPVWHTDIALTWQDIPITTPPRLILPHQHDSAVVQFSHAAVIVSLDEGELTHPRI